MTFLPEDDIEFLGTKGIPYELKTEKLPDGNVRNGIVFPAFPLGGNLHTRTEAGLVSCTSCDLMIVIPQGYATTKLDSFYTRPHLKRKDGNDPEAAAGEGEFFSEKWQFWSRHLADTEWRPDIDGLETYLQYVRAELRKA